MRDSYADMYALFRHVPGAEDYFEGLPSYVQDRISPRYQCIDSFERLEEFAGRYQREAH